MPLLKRGAIDPLRRIGRSARSAAKDQQELLQKKVSVQLKVQLRQMGIQNKDMPLAGQVLKKNINIIDSYFAKEPVTRIKKMYTMNNSNYDEMYKRVLSSSSRVDHGKKPTTLTPEQQLRMNLTR